jgi:uncharacterized protein (TIGR02284 family)
MEESQEPLSTIVELIGTLKDGERGYAAAAEAAKDPRIKSLFGDYARQRTRFLTQFRQAACRFAGAEPQSIHGTVGALHRAWISFRTMVSRGDDRALLAECERGEESAIHHYEKALQNALSEPIREIVVHQYEEVRSAHDRVHYLRDVAHAV